MVIYYAHYVFKNCLLLIYAAILPIANSLKVPLLVEPRFLCNLQLARAQSSDSLLVSQSNLIVEVPI